MFSGTTITKTVHRPNFIRVNFVPYLAEPLIQLVRPLIENPADDLDVETVVVGEARRIMEREAIAHQDRPPTCATLIHGRAHRNCELMLGRLPFSVTPGAASDARQLLGGPAADRAQVGEPA